MRGGKRGLILALVVLAMWGIAGFAFYRMDEAHDQRGFDLMADLIAHKRQLVAGETKPGPRIIIAGGSNAYYGIDADVIEQRTGIPVVNFAFPFDAYDRRINLALLERVVRPGDVVIFAAASFWGSAGNDLRREIGFDKYLAEKTPVPYTRQFKDSTFPWQARPKTNTLLLALADLAFGRPKARSWVADTDSQGDFTGCVPRKALLPQIYQGHALDADLMTWVKEAVQRLEKKDARLMMALPWVYIREQDRPHWENYRARFLQRYRRYAPVIAAPPKVMLRSRQEDFCDSPFHLSRKMTNQRSKYLSARVQILLSAKTARREE